MEKLLSNQFSLGKLFCNSLLFKTVGRRPGNPRNYRWEWIETNEKGKEKYRFWRKNMNNRMNTNQLLGARYNEKL